MTMFKVRTEIGEYSQDMELFNADLSYHATFEGARNKAQGFADRRFKRQEIMVEYPDYLRIGDPDTGDSVVVEAVPLEP